MEKKKTQSVKKKKEKPKKKKQNKKKKNTPHSGVISPGGGWGLAPPARFHAVFQPGPAAPEEAAHYAAKTNASSKQTNPPTKPACYQPRLGGLGRDWPHSPTTHHPPIWTILGDRDSTTGRFSSPPPEHRDYFFFPKVQTPPALWLDFLCAATGRALFAKKLHGTRPEEKNKRRPLHPTGLNLSARPGWNSSVAK